MVAVSTVGEATLKEKISNLLQDDNVTDYDILNLIHNSKITRSNGVRLSMTHSR